MGNRLNVRLVVTPFRRSDSDDGEARRGEVENEQTGTKSSRHEVMVGVSYDIVTSIICDPPLH
jgi:hypothetical protein